jgi:hypothetical protein
MTTDRFPRILLAASIPVALVALAQVMYEDRDDWSQALHGHRIVLTAPVMPVQGILILLLWCVPTAVVLAVVARRKLWRSRLAIGAIACWTLFTAYSWAIASVLVFYSQ